jgi:hypothetical protein
LGKGTFPRKRILTREQARFIVYCLALDRIKQKAKGSRYHSYGLLTRLAKTFGVTRDCIVQIDLRRIWRSINRPKPKQLFFAKKRALEGEILEPPTATKRQRHTEEYLHQVVRYVSSTQDEPGMLPRDAIQRAQDFFHEEANEALEYYEFLRSLLDQPKTVEESEELESRLAATARDQKPDGGDEQPGVQEPALLPRQGISGGRRPAESAGCGQADVPGNRRCKPRETDMDEAGSEARQQQLTIRQNAK